MLEANEPQRMTLFANPDPDHDSHHAEDNKDGRARGGDSDDTTQLQHIH